MLKIKNRKRYVRKQKADTSKDDELDLLGDKDMDSFTGSRADLEDAADNLFPSPPCPQLYNRKWSLSSKNPWVLSLTFNCNSKWGFSRPLCLRP